MSFATSAPQRDKLLQAVPESIYTPPFGLFPVSQATFFNLAMSAFTILVGGYTSMITALSFTPGSTSLSTLSTSYAGINPTWITTHPTNKSVLFATQETYSGAVWSFYIGSAGRLTQVCPGQIFCLQIS